jgi:hypothetical protein
MKRKSIIVLCSFLVGTAFLVSSLRLQSHILRPLTGGLCNDPGESTCVSCHQYGPFVDSNRFIFHISADSAGLANSNTLVSNGAQYTPGYTQWVSIELVGANGPTPDYGFQLTALHTDNSMAGSFTLTNTSNTSMETLSATPDTRTYVAHANASSNKIWSFKWTAPDSGNVTFYFNANFGNGDSQPTGDTIFRGTVLLTKGLPSGIHSVNSDLASISLYPVPLNQQLATEMHFNASSTMSMTMLSMDGKEVKALYSGHVAEGTFSRSFDISDIAAGVYLVRIQSGDDARVIKVLKY